MDGALNEKGRKAARTNESLHEFGLGGDVEEFLCAKSIVHGFTKATEVIEDLYKGNAEKSVSTGERMMMIKERSCK